MLIAYSNICSPFPADLNPLLVSQDLVFVRLFVFAAKDHSTKTWYDEESQLRVENGFAWSLLRPSHPHMDTPNCSLQF